MSEPRLHHPTDDVQSTYEWLQMSGFTVVSSRGGPGESFGNQVVELSHGSSTVRITRDRGQWMLELQPTDWGESCSLEQLLAAMRLEHLPTERHSGPMPTQIPPDEVWSARLPEALDWTHGLPHRSVFVDIERQRYGTRNFGGRGRLPEFGRIEGWVKTLADAIGAPNRHLPTFGYSEDFARPHVEASGRQLAFVVVERGEESERVVFAETVDLLQQVFLGVTFNMAVDWEVRHRSDDEDFRRRMWAKQLVLLDRLHPVWAESWADRYGARFRTVGLDRTSAHALVEEAEGEMR